MFIESSEKLDVLNKHISSRVRAAPCLYRWRVLNCTSFLIADILTVKLITNDDGRRGGGVECLSRGPPGKTWVNIFPVNYFNVAIIIF